MNSSDYQRISKVETEKLSDTFVNSESVHFQDKWIWDYFRNRLFYEEVFLVERTGIFCSRTFMIAVDGNLDHPNWSTYATDHFDPTAGHFDMASIIFWPILEKRLGK